MHLNVKTVEQKEDKKTGMYNSRIESAAAARVAVASSLNHST